MNKFNYNFWDERYSTDDFIYGKEPNEFFRENLLKIRPGKLFLPGEGEGRNAVFAAKQGWSVDATDQSKVGKSKALKLASESGVKINYSVRDISEYNFPENYYDAAAIIFIHLNAKLRKKVHNKILRSLKINGVLILELFNKEQLGKDSGGPQNIDMLYSQEDIERNFKSLRTILLENKTVLLNEGKKHSGESSVIRFVGIKQ